jgi:hypothetical protein
VADRLVGGRLSTTDQIAFGGARHPQYAPGHWAPCHDLWPD